MRGHWTFIVVSCGKNWEAAATASKPWSASVIVSSVACLNQRPWQVQRMIEFRSFFGPVFLALIALLVLPALIPGLFRMLILVALVLVIGFSLGLLLGRRRERATASETDLDIAPSGLNSSPFSARFLDSALREMREGLLVIDADMRVVASNRAARNLFSDLNDVIDSRRLTELTRNPAIYAAFLDAVRGKERTGVKVETYGQQS